VNVEPADFEKQVIQRSAAVPVQVDFGPRHPITERFFRAFSSALHA
jgi:thioredoxin-like negative regulator of GroEL